MTKFLKSMKHYETDKKRNKVAEFTKTKAKMGDRPRRLNSCDEDLDIWISSTCRWDTFGLLDKLPLTAVNRFVIRKTLKRYYIAVDEILQLTSMLCLASPDNKERIHELIVKRNVATCDAHIYKNTFVDYFDKNDFMRYRYKQLLDTIFGVNNWHWRTELSNL